MVGPEDYDGIVSAGRFFKSVKDVAEHGIGEVNGGEVALNTSSPFAVPLNVREVTISCQSPSRGRNVIEIIGPVTGGQLNLLNREGRKVLGGNKPRFVWPVESAG